MRPRDVVLLLCPLVTPTPTLLWLDLLLPLSTCHSLTHSTPPGLAVLRSHQALEASTHYFGWFASSPLHTPFTYLPIPHHQVWQCFAHIKHLKHKHITSGLVCFFPSPLPLVHSLTLPQQVSSAIYGSLVVCMGHLGVHIM